MYYSELFMDCFLNTHHAGVLSGEHVYCYRDPGSQPFSSFAFYIRVTAGKVSHARFEASTTPVLIAVGEYLARFSEGKFLQELRLLTPETIVHALSLPLTSSHSAHLAHRIVRHCLAEVV